MRTIGDGVGAAGMLADMSAVITNTLPDFFTYWRASRGEPLSVQKANWEDLYIAPNAALWAFYNREHGSPQPLETTLKRYEAHIGHIQRVASGSEATVRRVTALCETGFGVGLPVHHILMVGRFTSNAWADRFRDAPICFYALELIPDEGALALMVAHETTHVVHHSLIGLEFDRQNVAETLFLEGLATLGELLAVPGLGEGAYLWPGYERTTDARPVAAWLDHCVRQEAVLSAQLLEVAGSRDETVMKRFFNANPRNKHPDTPIRAGYFVGYRIVKELGGRLGLPELARLERPAMNEAVVRALRAMR